MMKYNKLNSFIINNNLIFHLWNLSYKLIINVKMQIYFKKVKILGAVKKDSKQLFTHLKKYACQQSSLKKIKQIFKKQTFIAFKVKINQIKMLRNFIKLKMQIKIIMKETVY